MSRPRHWIPPGAPTTVAGHDIPGGLIYVGQHLRSAVGTIEPALINPALPVDRNGSDRCGHDLDPAPSYHLISPASRAAYLAWLAGGRERADVPIGFVSMFFAGLERRVLVDAAHDPAVRLELPTIAAAVRRLRAVHAPTNGSFTANATAFLDVLDLLTAPAGRPGGAAPSGAPPTPGDSRWPVPVALRTALARFAVTGTPVPANWARSWAWHHPSLFPRTPQTRCPREFEQLFTLRYTRRFGGGLIPQATARPPIRIGYQPASPGIDAVVMDRPDLPDVLEEPRSTRELGALVDAVTDALTPYSRWLARTPGGLGSLASTVLLPTDLLDRHPGPLRPLLAWADARLDGRLTAAVDGADFDAFWSTANPARMSREEAASLALVLARVGLGVEPDVRFGGPALGPGPAVLFRLDPEAADRASTGYLAATTMLHLAACVAAAAGQASQPGDRADPDDPAGLANRADPDGLAGTTNVIITGLAAEVRLTVSERSRLAARLRWLLATGADFTRLDRRISALTAAEREAAGHFLVSVAAARPPVSPATVAALTRAYRLIGLDTDLVYRRLHHRSLAAGGLAGTAEHRLPPAEEPIVVRRARVGPLGHALPRMPPGAAPATEPTLGVRPDDAAQVLADAPREARSAAGPGVTLSRDTVTRKLAETEAVSSLLAGIFTDDGPAAGAPAAPTGGTGTDADTDRPAGLDEAHSRLLGEIGTRSSWSRADFAELAARHGVLPSGALDVINEVAMEAAGEPVVEGDDELMVNDDALREMLARTAAP